MKDFTLQEEIKAFASVSWGLFKGTLLVAFMIWTIFALFGLLSPVVGVVLAVLIIMALAG